MEVSLENTSTLGRRLKISVPGNNIQTKITQKLTKLSKEVRLKGFRAGKIPAQVIQKKFGTQVRAEVIGEVIRQSLQDAMTEKKLHLAGTPKIEDIKDSEQSNLEFTATFEVYPEIQLADMGQATIEKRVVKISDEDVQNMVTKLQDEMADWLEVEGGAQNGHKVTVDFKRLLKKENATEEEQKNVQLILGHEGVLPELNAAFLGKNKGDTIEIEVRYPDDWADAKVAGLEASLTVLIHQISEKKILTEESLAEKLAINPFDKEQLFEKVREKMQEELDGALKDEVKESILEKLLELNSFELPQALIEQEKESMRKELSQQQQVNIPIEAMQTEEVQTQAKRRVELGLLLNEVIRQHEIVVDKVKVHAEIEKIAKRFNQKPEIIESYYRSNNIMPAIERMVLLEQAVEAMLEIIQVTEVTAKFDEVMNPVEN